MSRVLVLMASCRHNGKTAKLLNFYLNKLKESEQTFVEVQLVNIYDFKILPCNGCGLCECGGKCPKNEFDDFLKIAGLIRQSSCFVVASPTYFSGFPAKLKALIDRCEQLYCDKKKFGEFKNLKLRRGHLVLTAGRADFLSLKAMLRCCRQFFDCFDVEFENCLVAPRTDFNGLFFLIN